MLKLTLQRMWLMPARLVLALLSVFVVFCGLGWMQYYAWQVNQRLADAVLFDGHELYVLTTSPTGGGYNDLVAPYLDQRVLGQLSGVSNTGIWVLATQQPVQVGDEAAVRNQTLAVAVNGKALAAAPYPQCVWIGGEEASVSQEVIRFPLGMECQVVEAPAAWRAVKLATESRVLVVSLPFAEQVSGPRWTWMITKAMLSLPMEEATISAAFAEAGVGVKISRPGDDAMPTSDVEHRRRLNRTTDYLRTFGSVVSSVCLLLLLAGQSFLQVREIGLLQLLGASPRRAVCFFLLDVTLQAVLVSVPVLLLLPVALFVPNSGPLLRFGALFFAVLVLVAWGYALVELWLIGRMEPGAMVRGDRS